MKKIEKLALDEIKQKSGNIDMSLYSARADLLAVKQTLMHCDLNRSKEALQELILTTQKAIAEVEKSQKDSKIIGEWASSLKDD